MTNHIKRHPVSTWIARNFNFYEELQLGSYLHIYWEKSVIVERFEIDVQWSSVWPSQAIKGFGLSET